MKMRDDRICDFDAEYKLRETVEIEKLSSLLYYDFTKNFVFEGESHDYWEFVYTDKGEIIATAEERDLYLKQGEIIFHKPNEFHKLRSNGSVAPNVVVISFHCHSPAMEYFYGKHMRVPEEYRWIISKILEEAALHFEKNTLEEKKNSPTGSEQLIKNYLEMFFIYLLREDESKISFSEKNISENRIVCDIIGLMEERMRGGFDITFLCKRLGYGKTYLCTLFKEQTGVSIMQYYTDMRIGEAKRLLRESGCNITEVARELNFNNPHYFSHVFGKVAGMSPREYMKSVYK